MVTSYSTGGTGQTPSMTVSFQMDITTYGPHNGIFITSGVQPGPQGPWGFFGAVPPNQHGGAIQAPALPAITAPTPAPAPQSATTPFGSSLSLGSGRTTAKPESDRLDLRGRSRPASPAYGRDSPPDEFIAPEKVRLNVFEDKPYVQHPTDYVLNDTTTTTTTVEVFRAKVDARDPVDFFELPPDPLGPDNRPQLVRAVGPPYEVASRCETRFSDRPVTVSGIGSQNSLPRVQWENEEERRLALPASSAYSGSLERNRSLGGSLQSREPWVDGDYQTTITRRQLHSRQEDRLEASRSRPASPSVSIGPVYSLPARDSRERERDEERYRPRNEERYEEREPRPLRHTISQPDVFGEGRTRRRHHSVNADDRDHVSGGGGFGDEGRLRRARSRSETRLDEEDFDWDRARPTSAASNNSIVDHWNDDAPLYETRDCLGRVLYRVRDRPQAPPTPPSILRSDRDGVGGDGTRSRVEFLSPADTARSEELQLASRELQPEAPICEAEDTDTPRGVTSPGWRVERRRLPEAEEKAVEAPLPPPPPPPPRSASFSGPVCVEMSDSVEEVPLPPPPPPTQPPISAKPVVEKLQLSESANAQLMRHGWLSPRRPRTTTPPATTSTPIPIEVETVRGSSSLHPLVSEPPEEHLRSSWAEALRETSVLTPTPSTSASRSFSECLRAQFEPHSNSPIPCSPAPAKMLDAAAKPPLPPVWNLRSLRPSVNDSFDVNESESLPSVQFVPRRPVPWGVRVVADEDKLRISGLP